MSTTRQKVIAMHVTRFLIFILGSLAILLDRPVGDILGSLAILLDRPVGDILGVLSLMLWLWLPMFVRFELKLLEWWIK
jgi:hypothetical protein